MKLKVSEWRGGCGDTAVGSTIAYLRAQASDELEINLTPSGIEIVENGRAIDYLASVKEAILDLLQAHTAPVALVDDPYKQANVGYVVIDIDPCSPVIREVPAGSANSFATLVDAKEAARQLIQAAMAKAASSLVDLRQVGIEPITYITLDR